MRKIMQLNNVSGGRCLSQDLVVGATLAIGAHSVRDGHSVMTTLAVFGSGIGAWHALEAHGQKADLSLRDSAQQAKDFVLTYTDSARQYVIKHWPLK